MKLTLAVSVAAVAVTAAALWGGATGETVALTLDASREQVAGGQLWRLLTGPFIHTSTGMLLRDVGMLAFLGFLYERALGRARFTGLMAAGLLGPTIAVLVFQPQYAAYYGLSGVVNALFVAAFLYETVSTRGRPPWWLVAMAIGFVAKLVYETYTGELMFAMDIGAGVAPAPLSHLVGAGIGALFGLSFRRRRKSEDNEPASTSRTLAAESASS